MFIRETSKTVQGKSYYQHQLVESVRTKAGPRQQIVLNLGTLEIGKDRWKELANSIESQLKHQDVLFSDDPEIQGVAKHFSQLIVQKRLNESSVRNSNRSSDSESTSTQNNSDTSPALETSEQISSAEKNIQVSNIKKEPVYETISINTIKNSNSRTIGAEQVFLSQIDAYGLEEILRDLNFTDQQIRYAKMLIIGRAVHPGSERETCRWTREDSALKELLKTKDKVYDMALHRVADKLWGNKEAIERALSKQAKDQFNLEENIILYDLTNTFFEGQKLKSHIAKRGRSKEKRSDCPLVTLALTVDSQGFPKHSEIYPGNVSEPSTLEDILNHLCRGHLFPETEKTIVIDAGIATQENIDRIKKRGFKYVAVARNHKYEKELWEGCPEERLLLSDQKTELFVKLAKKDGESYLLCHSKAKEAKERSIWERRFTKFESALKALNDGLKKKRTRKTPDYIHEKIGRLKELYSVGNLYEIEVRTQPVQKSTKSTKKKEDKMRDKKEEKKEDKKGENPPANNLIVTQIVFEKNAKREAKEEQIGTYVLRSNRMDINAETFSQIHRSLTTIESCFEGMKSSLEMRPIYHHKDTASKAHIFITVLAYHMLAGIQAKLKKHGIHKKWKYLRSQLMGCTRVTTSFETKEGDLVHVRNTTDLNYMQAHIYEALEIKPDFLGPVNTKIYLSENAKKS